MTFAIGLDAMWVYEAYPIAVDKCFVTQTACFPPETVAQADFDELVEAYYHRLDAALAEDIPALVNQQRGLSCPETRQGRLQPLREANVASFARWYAGKMGGVTA
jgi:phenylpropionate dioxygenase-like ring-hydroxylating dioxygenase large terminal subunit